MLYFGVRPTLRQCVFPPEIVHELTNDQLIQIFDCLVFKGWSVGKVSHDLKVTRAAVYLARASLAALLAGTAP